MPSRPHDSLVTDARRLAWLAAVLVTAFGAITLLGWLTGVSGVARLTPHAPAMTPNTAVALVLFGLALMAHARPPARAALVAAARAAGWTATLLSAAVTLEWVLDSDFGIDQLLFTVSQGPHPGRMGSTACVAMTALGVALELDRRRRMDGRVVNLIALAPLLLGLLSVSGHLSGVVSFTGLGGALRIAPSSACALILAGVALLLARPERETIRLLVSSGPGGLTARRLLPVAVALPLVLNALPLGVWAFSFLVLTLFGLVIVRLARGLDLLDIGRRAAEERLRHSEAQARSVTDTAHDAIVGADDQGAITLFNPGAERLFGWAAAEVIGRPVTLLMPDRYREGHRAGIARLGAGAPMTLAGTPLELHGVTKADREFDLELSLAEVGQGIGRGVIAIMRDISPRKLLERIAREESERSERIVAAQNAIVEGAGELGPTLDLVAVEAREIVGADGAVVELPDGEDMVYRSAAGAGAAHRGARVRIAGSLAGEVLGSGTTAVCDDTETDPRVDRDACRRIGVRSMVCVALRHRGETVGVLKVFSGAASAFDERDARTLEVLAGLAAATVHRAQVERRIAALQAAGEALAGARSLEAGLAGALRGVGEQLGWDLGAVWLAGAHDGALTCAETWHGASLPAGPYLELCGVTEAPGGGGLPDVVRRAGTAIWVEHADQFPDAALDPRRANAAAACGLHTLAAVPIVSRGETLGVVELASGQERTHDSQTLELIADVATAIGQFVQRRRAEDRITVQAANLAAVAELSRTLDRSRDHEQTRPILVRAIRDLARADSVILLEPDGPDHLAITAEAGGLVPEGTRLHLQDDAAIAIDVFRAGRGRFVADYLTEEHASRDAQQRSELRSAHYEPILRDGRVAGVLVVATRELRAKDAGGLDALMRLLAGEAGTALALSDLVARLDAQARTDQLTGLANRRTWDHELPRELSRARRTDAPLSLAILDLDHFKAYNDAYGHPAGDRLLRGAAAAWAQRLRATDVLARYGGEEFAVLLPGCDAASAARVVEQLRAAVPDEETCSIGVATWDGEELAEALVARADTALYRAKGTGRDRVVAAV
jgi:diguanylate cyclase (GGDEF)-like protein/PAS domain S-box-containing protein